MQEYLLPICYLYYITHYLILPIHKYVQYSLPLQSSMHIIRLHLISTMFQFSFNWPIVLESQHVRLCAPKVIF